MTQDASDPQGPSATDRVAEQTVIRHALLDAGYVPLGNVSKKCMLKNWPRLEVTHKVIEDWADSRRLLATGVRMEGDLVALDFDIDDAGVLDAIWDAMPDDLFGLVEQMPVRRGGGAKVCLFCRLAPGEALENLWSKAYYEPGAWASDPATARTQRLEVFTGHGSAGRQIGVYGAHTVEGGVVTREYSWAGGVGLADVRRADLVEVTAAQLVRLVDLVSEVLHGLGWVYEVQSLAGQVSTARVFTLTDDMTFDVLGLDESVDLEGLRALAEGERGIRVSLGFVEKGAVNRTRGLVSLNPADDDVQVWDTMTAILYRPLARDLHNRMEKLAARLGGQTAVPRVGEEGSGLSRLDALLAAVPEEDRLFGGAVEAGGGGASEADDDVLIDGAVNVSDSHIARAAALLVAGMRDDQEYFDYGDQIGLLRGQASEVVVMGEHNIAHELGLTVPFVKKKGKRYEDTGPPLVMIKQIMALGRRRGLRPLTGVTDLPVVTLDGRVLVGDDYDAESGLAVRCGGRFPSGGFDFPPGEAWRILWAPFAQFPFASEVDRGGAVAAVLTALVRGVLPTAPAFGMDAPVPGSGKTLFASAVGRLLGARGADLQAPLPVKDETEVRKILLSLLLKAPRGVIFDNQLGVINSASLATMLTSDVMGGRVLGGSVMAECPTRLMVMFTGNNLFLGGDMPRRVVKIRIDPRMETPFTRVFDFDPLVRVGRERDMIARAGVSLIRMALRVSEPGRIGSFEAWDQMVAQTVRWIGRNIAGSNVSDPTDLLLRAHETDTVREETADLIEVLRDKFGNQAFAARDVHVEMTAHAAGAQRLLDAFGLQAIPTSRTIGMMLQHRRGQRVGSRWIDSRMDTSKNTMVFYVRADEDEAGVVVRGAFARDRGAALSRVGHIKPSGG